MKLTVSRYSLTSLLLIGAMAVLAWLLEMVLPFDAEFFAYPLNLVICALWAWGVIELYRAGSRSIITRYLLSRQATVTSVTLLAAACMAMGLQRVPATESYLFLFVIFFVITQLSLVTLRGWLDKFGIRWTFLCCHLGLLLVLIAGFWGASDTRVMRAELAAEKVNTALCEDGKVVQLDYTLHLTDFNVDYFENGVPSHYEALLDIDGKIVTLAVNHPHKVAFGEHIYLTSFDNHAEDMRCIVQIVRQPWRGVMVTGILMLIVGALLLFFRRNG